MPCGPGDPLRKRGGRLFGEDGVVGLTCDEAVCAVVCTQSKALAERLRHMLLRWACRQCVSMSVEWREQLSHQQIADAQLLILDIDSVELPEWRRMGKDKAGLIVVSRDAGRVIHSYRWHPSAFLKPDFDARRLSDAMGSCEKHWRRGRICLDSPYQRRGFRLPLGSVRYVEAAAHYSLFDQGKQSVRIRYPINELETVLPDPPFVRCHRSYLVHLDAVESMTYTTIALKDGTCLPLGRTHVKSLQKALKLWREEEKLHDDLHTDL